MVRQGDIILIEFASAKGNEEQEKKQALVVSNDEYHKHSNIVWVCPIACAMNYPLHIDLPEGLQTSGKVLCEHLQTIDIATRGYERLETVPEVFLCKVLKYLNMIIER